MKQHFDWGGGKQAKTSKNIPWQKKSGQLCRFCPVMPEKGKNLIITCFLVKFCFIRN